MANELLLTFDFETPVSAENLAEVIVALGRDYRESTDGRTLVVSRVETGSVTLTFIDAVMAAAPYVVSGVAIVQGVNALATFAENVKKWFGRAKTDEGKKRLQRRGKKLPGQRSVEAILAIAAKTGSHVKVKHTKPNGETLEAELTPSEALANQFAKERAKLAKARVQRPAAPDVQDVIIRLEHAYKKNRSLTELEAIMDVIVAVLRTANAEHLLSEIASELSVRGQHAIAEVVRQRIHRGGTGGTQLVTT
jgi:hypothetical protein